MSTNCPQELKPRGIALGPVLRRGPFEFVSVKQLQHPAENAPYLHHGGVGLPYDLRPSTQTVAEFCRRRSERNLDESEFLIVQVNRGIGSV